MKFENLPIYIEGQMDPFFSKVLGSFGLNNIIHFSNLKELEKLLLNIESNFILIKNNASRFIDYSLLEKELDNPYNIFLGKIELAKNSPEYLLAKKSHLIYFDSNNKDLNEGYKDSGVYLIKYKNKNIINALYNNDKIDLSKWKLKPIFVMEESLFLNQLRPCLFLDRDGIINTDTKYLYKIEDLKWVDGIVSLIQTANSYQLPVVVVTNQSGVGRGFYKESDVIKLHEYMKSELDKKNAFIDSFYYCLYHPKSKDSLHRGISLYRKPSPGMILEASKSLKAQLNHSIMVGDKVSDYIDGDLFYKTFHLKGNYDLSEAKGTIINSLSEIEEFIRENYKK